MEILTPLEKSISQLEHHYNLIHSQYADATTAVKAAFQTASIKSFEYAYELSVKALRRRLEDMAASAEEIDELGFKPMMRTAAEKGLVEDPVAWFLYREKRNITVHTYDETKALDVISVMPEFLKSVRHLLNALKDRSSALV